MVLGTAAGGHADFAETLAQTLSSLSENAESLQNVSHELNS